MRLALVISSLQAGGAERVLVSLANLFAASGDEVLLVTIASSPAADFFPLDQRVRRASSGTASSSGGLLTRITANFGRVARLHRLLKMWRPDCVISFGDRTNVIAVIAAQLAGTRVIASERTDPDSHDIGGRVWELLRRLTYRRADRVVFQTRGVAERFVATRAKAKAVVIGNPLASDVAEAQLAHRPAAQGRRYRLLAIGRLAPEKGFDLLLGAFSRVASRLPEWDLHIFGEGDERNRLEAMLAELGLQGRAHLRGRTDSPGVELSVADAFALSSRFEGLPNAMLEAMGCGVPVVATDCGSGPRELARGGLAALLVAPNDVAALAIGLERLMAAPELRDRLGAAGLYVREAYAPERICAQWRSLIEEVCR